MSSKYSHTGNGKQFFPRWESKDKGERAVINKTRKRQKWARPMVELSDPKKCAEWLDEWLSVEGRDWDELSHCIQMVVCDYRETLDAIRAEKEKPQ